MHPAKPQEQGLANNHQEPDQPPFGNRVQLSSVNTAYICYKQPANERKQTPDRLSSFNELREDTM